MSDKKERSSAINLFFLVFIVGSVLFAAMSAPEAERMKAIQEASFESAKAAVTLAIGLVGVMALWLGLMRVLEVGGFMHTIARWLRPLMVRLFPDVPADHPAMGAMVLNMSANMLGLGNAATPFGIRAMIELNKLNPFPGVATNAMCLFLAINTSSVTILPLGVIGVRAAAGSLRPADIFLPTLLATVCSTTVAIIVATLLARISKMHATEQLSMAVDTAASEAVEQPNYDSFRYQPSLPAKTVSLLVMALFIGGMSYHLFHAADRLTFFTRTIMSFWLMPFLMLLICCYGIFRGVKVYESVTDGAKQGFDVAVRIIPYLVAILVGIGMFRASGAMEYFVAKLAPWTLLIGMPADVLPMAIIRPLSGSGAFAIMSALVQESPDSYQAFLASTLMGSTETTFYVLAVYFGSVGVFKVRHALVAALAADVAGITAACFFSAMFYGG